MNYKIILIKTEFIKKIRGDDTVVKKPANTADAGSIPGSGRFPGEGNGNPLQDSCLEDLMDRGAWRATVHKLAESDTTEQLSTRIYIDTHTHTHTRISRIYPVSTVVKKTHETRK